MWRCNHVLNLQFDEWRRHGEIPSVSFRLGTFDWLVSIYKSSPKFRVLPPHLARHLLFAMLAYRLQAEVMGDLDAETVRFLKQVDLTSSKQAAVPLTQAFEQQRSDLSPGTVLTREWSGRHHRIMVIDGGFAWEGRTYGSLSEIAKAITGTKWNGPRFFGLRDKKTTEAMP